MHEQSDERLLAMLRELFRFLLLASGVLLAGAVALRAFSDRGLASVLATAGAWVLIATPLLRVIFCVVSFAARRQRPALIASTFVLVVLVLGAVGVLRLK